MQNNGRGHLTIGKLMQNGRRLCMQEQGKLANFEMKPLFKNPANFDCCLYIVDFAETEVEALKWLLAAYSRVQTDRQTQLTTITLAHALRVNCREEKLRN